MNDINEQMQAGQQTKKSMWPLWLLVAIFGVPLVVAYTMYFAGWMPSVTTNRGELIHPAQPVPEMEFGTPAGESLPFSSLRRQWIMMVMSDNGCEQGCRERVHDLRQIWKALAEGRKNVERLLVLRHKPGPDLINYFMDYKEMVIAIADEAVYDELVQLLAQSGEIRPGTVFLVDPMGNLMMRYLPEQPAKDILQDMEHLLSVSQFHK